MFLVEINNRLQELKHEERDEEQKVLAYLRDLLAAELPGAWAALDLLARLDVLQAMRRLARQGMTLHQPSRRWKASACWRPAIPCWLWPGAKTRRARDRRRRRSGPWTFCCAPANGPGYHRRQCGRQNSLPENPGARGGHDPQRPARARGQGVASALVQPHDAFIGDEQSLDDNVSTFTAQIDHLAKAWKHLDRHGLVLLDEFGAGTDPAQGAALAQAVLDELLDKHTFVLAATHFPALKSYALTREGARAASMLFDPATKNHCFAFWPTTR